MLSEYTEDAYDRLIKCLNYYMLEDDYDHFYYEVYQNDTIFISPNAMMNPLGLDNINRYSSIIDLALENEGKYIIIRINKYIFDDYENKNYHFKKYNNEWFDNFYSNSIDFNSDINENRIIIKNRLKNNDN